MASSSGKLVATRRRVTQVSRNWVPLVNNIVTSLWGAAGITPRETFAGDWQSRDRSSVVATPRSPLSNSVVYTCINNISSDVAKLMLRVMRPREKGEGREVHKNHPLNTLFHHPNHYQTSLQNYLASKLWTGNTYLILFRDARGVVQNMHVLDPSTVVPSLTEDGSIWYMVRATKLNGLTEDVYVPARNILHDRAVTLFHPLIGVSPLYAAVVSASIGNSISVNSEQFFLNMSRASGVLSAPGEITDPTAARLKSEWENNYRGLGFGKVAVLGSGLEWKPLNMTAVEAQLIDQLRYTAEDIGRIYRVPAFMLGDAKLTYRNSEQLARMYYQGCLSYHIESMEQCFNQKFEMTAGSVVEFDLRPLFRIETDLRYEAHQKALQSGIKSINEVRAEEDLPPVPGGEEPRLQMQYIPVSAMGQVQPNPAPGGTPAPAPVPAPAPPPPEDEEDEPEEASLEDIALVRERLVKAATPEEAGVT
jgi:HK97 family phage portal protein